MGSYRDRLQIIADVLFIANKRAKKTQIMYQANLSYKLLCRYLDEVTEAGLVNCENGDCYVLTTKGKEYLERHEEYSKRRKNLEEHLNHINNQKTVLETMSYTVNKPVSSGSKQTRRSTSKPSKPKK